MACILVGVQRRSDLIEVVFDLFVVCLTSLWLIWPLWWGRPPTIWFNLSVVCLTFLWSTWRLFELKSLTLCKPRVCMVLSQSTFRIAKEKKARLWKDYSPSGPTVDIKDKTFSGKVRNLECSNGRKKDSYSWYLFTLHRFNAVLYTIENLFCC